MAAADDDMTSLLGEFCMPDVDSESLLSQSQYAMVVFHDVAETYPLDSDVLCRFTLTSSIHRGDGDTVAVMPVGWSKPEESVVSHNVPSPLAPEQKEFEVVFKANELPRNNEIYQLCYLSKGEVRGASVPFQFRHATSEELMVLECGDMAVIRSQPAVAEDMKQQIVGLRHKLAKAQGELITAQDEARVAEERTLKLTVEHAKIKGDLESELKYAKEIAQDQLKTLIEEKVALTNALQQAREQYNTEKAMAAGHMETAAQRVRQLELDNMELAKRLEEVRSVERLLSQTRAQVQTVEEERDKAHEALQLAEVRIASLNDLVHGLQVESDRLERAVAARSSASAQEAVKSVQQELLRQREMLDAVQEAKELATREMVSAVRRREELEKELTGTKEAVQQMEEKLRVEREEKVSVLDDVRERHREERQNLLAQLTRLVSEKRDSMDSHSRVVSLTDELSESRNQVEGLQTEVTELAKKLVDIQVKHRELLQQKEQQELQHKLQQEEQQKQQQELQNAPPPPPQQPEAWSMSFSKEKAKAAAGVTTLTNRIRAIQEREQEVRGEEEKACTELVQIKTIVSDLKAAELQLQTDAQDLKQRYDEADDLCEATRAALHQRDLNATEESLAEKHVCLESAMLREQDLRLRLEELAQERAVLAQQAAHASSSLCNLANVLAAGEADAADIPTEALEMFQSPEVNDLRARLHTAADAYQQLYREKARLERRVGQLKQQLLQKKELPVGGPPAMTAVAAAGSLNLEAGDATASAATSVPTSLDQPSDVDASTCLACPFCPSVFPACARDLYHSHFDRHLP